MSDYETGKAVASIAKMFGLSVCADYYDFEGWAESMTIAGFRAQKARRDAAERACLTKLGRLTGVVARGVLQSEETPHE